MKKEDVKLGDYVFDKVNNCEVEVKKLESGYFSDKPIIFAVELEIPIHVEEDSILWYLEINDRPDFEFELINKTIDLSKIREMLYTEFRAESKIQFENGEIGLSIHLDGDFYYILLTKDTTIDYFKNEFIAEIAKLKQRIIDDLISPSIS